MREIRSPLDGILSPFAARFVDAYAVQGLSPLLVADFTTPYYRKAGAVSTFDSTFTHSRLGNATMVDSDGLIKWAPHNLALNSAAPATQSITVISGADYTVEITGSGSVALTGAGTGTVTAGNPVEITASTTTLTLTVTGTPSTMWAYRSDLGGMVNNPDTGTSYVPTTSAAVHQARRNHYTYNGASWVNSGLLLETEARTNLFQYSEDFADPYWTRPTGGQLGATVVGPDGVSGSGVTLEDNNATGTGLVYFFRTLTVDTLTTYTASIFAKKDQLQWLAIRLINFTTPPTPSAVWFDLNSGTKGTETNITGNIEPYNDGWYRCSITFTTDATDTSGNIQFFCCDSDNDITVDLDGTSSILIYGAQLEEGPTPSSYMPNYGTVAGTTRPTESLQIAAADMPWPTPNVIGPELVANGTFDTDVSGWSNQSGGVISWQPSEVMRVTPAVADAIGFGEQALTTVAGKVYNLTLDITATTASLKGRFYLGTAASLTDIFDSGSGQDVGTYEIQFVAQSATTYLGVGAWHAPADGVGYTEFDNVSVREIDPLSVSLQMNGKITYADEGAESQQTFARWYDDASNYITIDLDTDSTDTGEVNFEQQDGTGGTGTVTADTYSPGILVPYNIASRNTSTAINGATDGTAGTEDTTPTALPDLSAKDFSLGHDYMGNIAQFRAWNVDIGDAGIEDATS